MPLLRPGIMPHISAFKWQQAYIITHHSIAQIDVRQPIQAKTTSNKFLSNQQNSTETQENSYLSK